jgi:hypothetical protein
VQYNVFHMLLCGHKLIPRILILHSQILGHINPHMVTLCKLYFYIQYFSGYGLRTVCLTEQILTYRLHSDSSCNPVIHSEVNWADDRLLATYKKCKFRAGIIRLFGTWLSQCNTLKMGSENRNSFLDVSSGTWVHANQLWDSLNWC